MLCMRELTRKRDVRAAVDLCHRDGTLKQMVATDPKRYINEDDSIVPMLQMLRTSGVAVFLVTNSLWDYTNVLMNFLCGPQKLDSSSSLTLDWLKHFDVVITGSAKPKFFHDENRANLFAVQTDSGMLINTDNGSPMAQVGGPSLELPDQMPDKPYKVFQTQAWQEEVERAREGQRDAERKLSSLEAEVQKMRVEMAAMKRDAEHYFRQVLDCELLWRLYQSQGYQYPHQQPMHHMGYQPIMSQQRPPNVMQQPQHYTRVVLLYRQS